MKIIREYDFNDLYENSWSGAIDTLDTIIKNDMENELMEHLEEHSLRFYFQSTLVKLMFEN